MYGQAMTEVTQQAQSMWAGDHASADLGMTITRAVPGEAIATFEVAERHCNGLGVCHGGSIFTLADSAMAYATNAGDNDSLATNAEIDFIAAARPGDVLTATCRRLIERGKASVSDVVVTNQAGETIALFRGRTLAVGSTTSTAQPT